VNTLKARILRDARNLGGGILSVDSFINHQVDPALMDACGRALAARFAPARASRVLTAEVSGIVPALSTALHLGIPAVYARRESPVTMASPVLTAAAPSHTKPRGAELIVAAAYLPSDARVLIIDDFLATAQTVLGLARLTAAAGATLVGIGVLIEKGFEQGRAALAGLGVPIESLVTITDMTGGRIAL
jgi:xanthine phosphoribosyltransferase